ncbi:MAG: DUF1189 family protein [Chlamydiae bacterium]|nr:DUF1189 family protein [Chlamydiota bacterium]MBI3265510.1 DUF1189 family protein [Chlamydiota bacterium]
MRDTFLCVFLHSLRGFRYVSLVVPWSGKRIFGYLCFLGLCFSLVFLFFQLSPLIKGLNSTTEWAIHELPTFRIENGHLRILEESSPKKESESKKVYRPVWNQSFALWLDENAQGSDLAPYPFGMILKSGEMIVKRGLMIQNVHYGQDFSITISPYTLREARDILLWVSPLFLLGAGWFNLVLIKGLEAIFLGTLACVGSRLFGRKISWKSSFTLAVVALAPALLFSSVLGIFGISLHWGNHFYDGLYLLFFGGACIQWVREVR